MTQEAFKAWWYNEGSQAPYTHHDCEEHTMRMCEIAWANGAYKEREALAQTQEPVATDWNAVHEKLGLVWFRELSADEGLDEIQDLINTTPPQRTEPIQSLQCFHCQVTIETLNDKVMHLLAERRPLTDEEAFKLVEQDNRMEEYVEAAVRLIRRTEAAHGIKENT